MTRARLDALILFAVGGVAFLLVGTSLESFSTVSMVDFKAIYYSTQTLLQHGDPYKQSDLQRIYFGEDSATAANKSLVRDTVSIDVNLPTIHTFILPLALLPWGLAHWIWMLLIASSFLLAAYMMSELGASYAPQVSGLLIFLTLAGSELLIEVGNAAGIVVSLCAIAVWCFLRNRFALAGVLCLAIGLLIKPQDSGFVWLYFMLAGGTYRKRAWQTLLLAILLGLPGVLWVSHVAPNWMQEMHGNIVLTSLHGATNDPGPAVVDPRIHGAIIISLQTVMSIFRDDPRFYNLTTYLLCAPLVLVWMVATLRKSSSTSKTLLALAAIATLSMLPVYHRQHDTRLLLLMIPACAMLWAEGGPIAWVAFALSSLATVFTSNIALQLLAGLANVPQTWMSSWIGEILTILLYRPAPVILLISGVFYLWVYVQRCFQMESKAGASRVLVSSEQNSA